MLYEAYRWCVHAGFMGVLTDYKSPPQTTMIREETTTPVPLPISPSSTTTTGNQRLKAPKFIQDTMEECFLNIWSRHIYKG
jgi:hypothetical protein